MLTPSVASVKQVQLSPKHKAHQQSEQKSSDFSDLVAKRFQAKSHSLKKSDIDKNKQRKDREDFSSEPAMAPIEPRQNNVKSPDQVVSQKSEVIREKDLGNNKLTEATQVQTTGQEKTKVDGKLIQLRETLNQLRNVVDQQNQTIATMAADQDASFLQETEISPEGAGFSINQSEEVNSSGVLFWPGSDIDGLELKGSTLSDLDWQAVSQDDEALKKMVEQANLSVDKADLNIGTQPEAQPALTKNIESQNHQQLIGSSLGEMLAHKEQKEMDSQQSGDETLDFQNLVGGQATQVQKPASDQVNFATALSEASKNPEADGKIENMNDIVRQVRTVIKDGGGEMNVELMPEGLGRLQLKVSVDSGKVNVEMKADNDFAKKALEDSLHDMKASLEGQKLIVDNLKVDMSKDYQKDYSQQDNLMQDQANRQFAQQFMDQFHNERDERMGNLFDGFRSYIKEPSSPELALNTQRAYFGEGKGKSLNLKV